MPARSASSARVDGRIAPSRCTCRCPLGSARRSRDEECRMWSIVAHLCLPGAGAATPDYGTLTFQLSWVKNVEFAGSYIADSKGYYKKQGFSGVTLLSGGPTVQQDAVVQSGKAFACISAPDITSSAINNGA